MRTCVVVSLSLSLVLLAAGCRSGADDALSAGQRGAGPPTETAARDAQGGGTGLAAPVEVAEHTLSEELGIVVTASLEEGQVCLTATPTRPDGRPDGRTAVTDCASPDTPLDLRVLALGDDLEVLAGVVTDDRATDVLLVDAAGDPVPDEVDAVPLVDLPGTDHRVFAAGSGPRGLSEVQLADAEGDVIADRAVPG